MRTYHFYSVPILWQHVQGSEASGHSSVTTCYDLGRAREHTLTVSTRDLILNRGVLICSVLAASAACVVAVMLAAVGGGYRLRASEAAIYERYSKELNRGGSDEQRPADPRRGDNASPEPKRPTLEEERQRELDQLSFPHNVHAALTSAWGFGTGILVFGLSVALFGPMCSENRLKMRHVRSARCGESVKAYGLVRKEDWDAFCTRIEEQETQRRFYGG